MELYEIKSRSADNPPKPEQLFKLASAVVCLAKDQGRKKASDRADRAHILLPRRLESLSSEKDGGNAHYVTHSFTGRIARTAFRKWSMRLTEPYWVGTEEQQCSYRSFYTFEWTDKDVVLAVKRTRVDMSGLDESENGLVPDYGLQPITIEEEIFQPDLVNAVIQFETMSAADCDQLAGDVRAFTTASFRSFQYSH